MSCSALLKPSRVFPVHLMCLYFTCRKCKYNGESVALEISYQHFTSIVSRYSQVSLLHYVITGKLLATHLY